MINVDGGKYIWLREIIKYKDTHVKPTGQQGHKFMYVL